MKAFVVYDSLYGNTEKIAKIIAGELKARVVYVKDAKINDINGIDLLVIGSPTHGGRPTPEIAAYIKIIPSLKGIKSAAFDTRMSPIGQSKFMHLILKIFDFAAPKIAKSLKGKGMVVISYEGFIVEGKEGPLREGEIDRAKKWASKLKRP